MTDVRLAENLSSDTFGSKNTLANRSRMSNKLKTNKLNVLAEKSENASARRPYPLFFFIDTFTSFYVVGWVLRAKKKYI